jgi:hypothetical protein
MTRIVARLLALTLAPAAFAGSHEVSDEIVEKIEAMLAEMECQMDPDDIEVEDGGYELDDVICKGGQQMDIELDADLNEVGRRLE